MSFGAQNRKELLGPRHEIIAEFRYAARRTRRLKMSEYCLLIVCLVCKFVKISDCSAAKNSTDRSAIDSAADGDDLKNAFASGATTTEASGNVGGSKEPASTGAGGLWTEIDVTVRPHRTRSTSETGNKYRATLKLTSVTKSADAENGTGSIEDPGDALVSSNRSLEIANTSMGMPRKGVNVETGHAFLDDDDDDYDDDDEEYDKDYPKKDKEEVEEVEEPDQNVEEQADVADTEIQEYNESKCYILLIICR